LGSEVVQSATGTLVKTLAAAADIMLAVVFTPDGKRLAAAGADNAIRLFDLSTGKQQLLIEQHADWILDIAFAPDGGALASASRDKTARLFDTKTGELEQTYAGHSAAVFSVAFSADGKRVFSGSRDKEIHVWETRDAKKVTEITGFEGDVLKVLVCSNQIFSASTDYLVRQHSLDGRKFELVRTYAGHSDVVYGLAHHDATHRLASSSFDGEVRVWEINDGTLLTNYIAAPGYRSAGRPARESP
jgi:WD40 repeat protein